MVTREEKLAIKFSGQAQEYIQITAQLADANLPKILFIKWVRFSKRQTKA